MNIYPSIDIVLHAKSHDAVLKGFLQKSETYRVKYYLLSQEAHPEQGLNAHDAMQHLAQRINPLRSLNGQRNHIEPVLLGIAPEISFYPSYISAEEGNFGFCMLLNRDTCKKYPHTEMIDWPHYLKLLLDLCSLFPILEIETHE